MKKKILLLNCAGACHSKHTHFYISYNSHSQFTLFYHLWHLTAAGSTQNAHKDDSILDKKKYSENNINTVLRLIVLHVFSTQIYTHMKKKTFEQGNTRTDIIYICILLMCIAQWTDLNGKYFRNFDESFLFKG